MKRRIILVLLIILLLAACQNEVEESRETEESNGEISKLVKEMNEPESSPFSYGYGVKGGQYAVTLHTAYAKLNEEVKPGKPYLVTAVVEVKNVTGDTELNVKNIAFQLTSKDKDSSYQGVLPVNMNPSDLGLEREENVYMQVAFEVESIETDFIVTASVFNEVDMETQWKLEGLKIY